MFEWFLKENQAKKSLQKHYHGTISIFDFFRNKCII